MVSFVALFRGVSLDSAELIAVSADQDLGALVAETILQAQQGKKSDTDPAVRAVRGGRRRALRVLIEQAGGK